MLAETVKCLVCMQRRTFWSPMSVIAIVLIVGIPTGAQYAGRTLNILTGTWRKILMISPLAPLYYLFRSIWISPSVEKSVWRKFLADNPDAKKHLRYCAKCTDFRPYRASHCSICGVCVIRRDHHCPWINNCVSFFNHYHFIMFLITTILGLIVNCLFLYKSLQAMKNQEETGIDKSKLATVMMVIMMCGSMALSMVIAIPAILSQQIYAVFTNQSGCESFDLERINEFLKKKKKSQLNNIYNIGWKENLNQVYRASEHSGIVFPTVKGQSNSNFAKMGKDVDVSIFNAITDSHNVSVSKQSYDGSIFIKNDFYATLGYPACDTVLQFEQGEVFYNAQQRMPKSGWITVNKVVKEGHGIGFIRGKVPRVYVKTSTE